LEPSFGGAFAAPSKRWLLASRALPDSICALAVASNRSAFAQAASSVSARIGRSDRLKRGERL
jgi:hypothetical protein